jgi:hypothetical protein
LTERFLAALLLAVLAVSACATSTFNARPADVSAAGLSQDDVRTLMGDSNWWIGPPSFEVLPLNAATMDLTQQFSIIQQFRHIGTDESLVIADTVYDKVASASTRMTNLKNAFSTSPTSPKVGDDTLYNGAAGSGAAPFVYETFVRLSQIVVTIVWSRKSPGVTTQQLSKLAGSVVNRLKKMNSSKAHASPQAVDPKLLPPPGLDITYLGSAQLPIESWAVMILSGLPGTVASLMRSAGITDFAYGDYALNNDTSMEVQTALLKFATTTDASQWATTFAPAPPDDNGIANDYIKTAGSPAAGQYHYVFTSGVYGGYLICKSSLDGQAASRECEDPMERTAVAWRFALAA